MKKFLIIQTASIGDVILATPVAEKLHSSFPDAEIDILVKNGMQDLFKDHPFLNDVVVWNKRSSKNLNLLKIIRKIRSRKYDAVINIQRFASTGLLTAFSGAREKIGFKKNPFSFLFTKRVAHIIGDNTHEVHRNLLLIKSLTDDDKLIRPALYPGATDNAKMLPLKSGTYITISPASLWFTKQYPVDKWIEFLSYIDGKTTVYCLGAKGDSAIIEEIIRKSGHHNIRNLAGKLSFLESASLMKDAKMNYTNDSAPMHLASSVNAPVTAIFCSTVPEFGFGPLSGEKHIVQIDHDLYCRPCGLHGYRKCPEGHFRCAYEIRVEELVKSMSNEQ